MERVMSVEDKIRKAEEIYYRRKNINAPVRESFQKTDKKKSPQLLKKMIKQIIVCLLIYSISYVIINNNYIFSEDFTKKAREILSQDINFVEIYSSIINIMKQEKKVIQETEAVKDTEVTQNLEEKNEQQEIQEVIQNNDENIGGAEEGNEEVAIETPVLSQMEQDANYIKNTINFIKPVNGVISSKFGLRNSTIATVSKNHKGTDIAAVTGTKIVSATDGTVTYTSSKGDYGKHIKIQANDVTLLYAHCNKLYVKEGDVIKQGQEIAEVGTTGNSTGPHLHFEIRYQERYIDPQLVVEL